MPWRPKELVAALRRAGLVEVSQKGSHKKLRTPAGHAVIVPMHAADLKRGTLASILAQAGLTEDELNALR